MLPDVYVPDIVSRDICMCISKKLRKNPKMLLDTKHPCVQFKHFTQTTYKHSKQQAV